jgi:hypothetical protein
VVEVEVDQALAEEPVDTELLFREEQNYQYQQVLYQ